ncbi:MAG: hypothetical protein HYV07_26390 [Deltaproteobacteria bacterium]|nr:hypothetical protein [Deltaproteobacteria bacterium]
MVSSVRSRGPVSPLAPPKPPEVETPGAATPGDTFTRVADASADRKLKTFAAGRVEAPSDAPAPSKWWPAPGKEMDVDIDGHDFDFKPQPGKTGGRVDGPFSHDGRYSVTENAGEKFRMKVNVGSDGAQKGDLDVDLRVDGGTATITGTVSGKQLPEGGVSAPVTGSGTKSNPYRLEFLDDQGKSHSITWRPE